MSDNSEAFEENKSEMLEDEEMPTFISVSSKDISLPYTDANIELLAIDNAANPLLRVNDETVDDYEAQSRSPTTDEREEEGNEENEEEDSVYVLSSGDDADDADPSSRSYDEDVDEEEDVDDEDDEDIDGEIFQISYFPESDMEEIEPEEEEVGLGEDGQLLGDYSEDEIEKEDVMSDDLALRSDKPMAIINNEKRSQSLQDLSQYNSQPKRKSFITGGSKYNRVQSKVKRYIQDLKDKNRRSAEIRLKALEESKKLEEFESKAQEEEEEETELYSQKSSKGRRSIKGYAEQALKDLEIREELSQEEENRREEIENCIARPNNNMQTKQNLKTDNQGKIFNSEFKKASEIYREKKINMNGELTNEVLKNVKIPKGITVNYTLNGQTQGENILDVRSIGYDEYMRGSSNSSTEKNSDGLETANKLSQEETRSPKFEITNIQSTTEFNIEIKNLQNEEETAMEVVEPQEETEKIVEPEINDKMNKEALAEIALIQSQLNQKTTQCKEIREAYEKTLSENFELKQELEDLKKTLSKLTAKKQTPQLVAVAIQTDPPPPPPAIEIKDIPIPDNSLNPKLSTSSMGSAISSNEHWTESAGSLPLSNGSIRPLPNLTPLSNAEDSFIGVPSTPPRTPRQPSHTFQTSSRIIKMLSSITQRKPKIDSNINGEDNSGNIFGKTAAGSPGISNYNSPINHRGSNKRKATDMPDNSNFLQPPKIPHTSGNSHSHRLHRRTKSEFKYPGDYIKLNSQHFTTQSSDANRPYENLEGREDDPGDDIDSGVKCFTYREDDNSLETSFLIQAEEESKTEDGGKSGEQRGQLGVVRECGPYLLGNVEVRMTEINGTINIWGKEVSQETTIEDEPEEEADIEEDLNERGACGCWHKTPNARNTNTGPMSCSTNKKPKLPPLRLNESAYFKNYNHSPSTSTVDNFKEPRQHVKNSDNDSRKCELHSNSRVANKFKRFSNPGEEHNPTSNYCGCNNWDNENCDYASCGRVSRHCHNDHTCGSNILNIQGPGRCSRLNSGKDNPQSKTEENFIRNQSSRFTNNFDDDNVTCRHGVRRNSAIEDDDDVFKRPSTSSARVNERSCRNESCRSHSPSFDNQSGDPLLLHHPHEPPEARRRRSSGKRVRGILMDFLRGCGDCRTVNGPDNKVSPSIVPQIRIRSSTPPPTFMNQSQQRSTNYGSTNKRCVHMECCATCARRIEMAGEIETQLEIFGAEMERLRSRSQAVLGMLNTLHSADTN